MCGSDFTHVHHVSSGNMHDGMRSAQIAEPGTHSSTDVKRAIEPTLEKLKHINERCHMLSPGSREELFSAVEEVRLLVDSITNTLDSLVPVGKKEDQPPAATASA